MKQSPPMFKLSRSQRLIWLMSIIVTGLFWLWQISPALADEGGGLKPVATYRYETPLGQVRGMAVSPDNRYVYVTGYENDAVVVFKRDQGTGALTLLEKHYNVANGVDGLAGAYDVTLSPDGRNVYVTGYWSNAVAVFARDMTSGSLTFVQVIKDGDGGVVDGLSGATSVEVSPDGRHVYVAGLIDGAIAAFSRNGTNGALTFVEITRVGSSLDWSEVGSNMVVTLSSEGDYVYAASPQRLAIVVYKRDVTTGALTFVQEMATGVSELIISPDDRYLYATGWNQDGISLFVRDTTSGALTFSRIITGEITDSEGSTYNLKDLTSLVISPDGRQLYASRPKAGILAILDRDPTGGELTFSRVITPGALPSDQKGSMYGMMAMSPDGQSLYAATSGYSTDGTTLYGITLFNRKQENSDLTFVEHWQDADYASSGLYDATGIAVSPDDRHLYVTSTGNTVAIYKQETNGMLSFIDMIRNDPNDQNSSLHRSAALTLSPDGRYLYVARTADNAVVIFERDQQSGQLTFVNAIKYGLSTGEQVVGDWLGVNDLAISPDGRQLYVASMDDNAIIVFNRTPSSGLLTFTETITEGAANPGGIVDGLARAASLTLSPDGRQLYAVGSEDSAVAVFSREPNSGHLTFVQASHNASPSNGKLVEGLAGARAIAASPDGRQLYVAGFEDNALAIFSREAKSGRLTFIEAIKDNSSSGPVNGLKGAAGVTVTPDGRRVYVVGYRDDALVVFKRDPSNGTLTFEETYTRGNGLDFGGWVVQTATDSQSKYIYVTGKIDSSLTVLSSPALTNTAITNNSALTSTQSSTITQLQVPCDKLTLFGEEDIYLANPDGTDLTLFMHSPTHFKDQARWSPDGTTLAYEVYGPRSDPGSLWTVTADGLDHEQLALYYYYGASWDWLPDSRYIVYSSSSSTHPQSYSISLMAIKAGRGDYTTYEPPYSAPYFNVPEYSASDRISGSFPFDGVPLNVGDNEWAFTKAPGTVERRYFSPNLEWVILKLFEHDKTVNYLARSNGSVVKPYPAYHSVAVETVCTTPDPWDEIDSHLAWTPDSRRVIFASHQDRQTQLWTLDVEDETETPIATFSAPGCPSGWRWSPDNRYATFSIATEAQRQQKISDIYVMAWPEGQPYLAVAGANYLPKWSSRSDYALLSADPRVVVWEARKGQAVMELDQPQTGYLCDWLLDGTRLTCPGFFWNVGAKEPEFVTMSGSAQWSPNGRWLADLDREGKLQVLDVETGHTTEIMTGVTNFTWSPRSCEVK